MNIGRQIVIVAAFIFLTVTITVSGQSFPLLSAPATNSFVPKRETTNTSQWIGDEQMESYSNAMAPHDIFGASDPTNVLPIIEFDDVPLEVALENLARQADFNHLLDPQFDCSCLDSQGEIQTAPIVTRRWKNVTATYAFLDICTNYGFKVVRDLEAGVVLVREKDHNINLVPRDFYGSDTNVIPLLEFQKVPISSALKNLAKQSRLRCIFSPRMDPWPSDSEQPQINARWEKITATQAFFAICENYDLNVIKYPESGIIRVEPAD